MCWGEDVFHQVLKAKNVSAAHEAAKNYAANGSITTAFKRKNKVQRQFTHQEHTKWQTRLDLHRYGTSEADTWNRAKIVQWVAESACLFEIVNNTGFQCLMKMGRPEYYLPKPAVVLRDVWNMFVWAWQRLAEKLQAYNGKLNFTIDTWTAPNHKSFTTVTMHLEDKGEALVLPLDVVEVARVSDLPNRCFGPIWHAAAVAYSSGKWIEFDKTLYTLIFPCHFNNPNH